MLLSSHPFFKLCALRPYPLKWCSPFLVKENSNGFIHLILPKKWEIGNTFSQRFGKYPIFQNLEQANEWSPSPSKNPPQLFCQVKTFYSFKTKIMQQPGPLKKIIFWEGWKKLRKNWNTKSTYKMLKWLFRFLQPMLNILINQKSLQISPGWW